jgi:hypothetical protein
MIYIAIGFLAGGLAGALMGYRGSRFFGFIKGSGWGLFLGLLFKMTSLFIQGYLL